MRVARPLTIPPLLAHKTLQQLRLHLDERGGYVRAARAAEVKARAALGADRFAAWVRRPNGGRFWLSPDVAPRWARRFCSLDDLRWAEAVVAGRFSVLGTQDV